VLFGSINYLNLLPFQLFLKRHLPSNASKMSFRYKRAVPSKINQDFRRKKVHAAFVSSVVSKKNRCTDLGIIAEKKVYSVLLLEGENATDPASETSNALARILNLQGKVIIGDAALKHYLTHQEGLDLAEAWYEKTKLPFVFARLCYNNHIQAIQKLAHRFAKSKIQIPQYILKQEARKRGITPKELLWYLEHIKYKMDYRSKRALKRFLKATETIK
jgi:chorismate dehydratase